VTPLTSSVASRARCVSGIDTSAIDSLMSASSIAGPSMTGVVRGRHLDALTSHWRNAVSLLTRRALGQLVSRVLLGHRDRLSQVRTDRSTGQVPRQRDVEVFKRPLERLSSQIVADIKRMESSSVAVTRGANPA
jgi:hypothetical protein